MANWTSSALLKFGSFGALTRRCNFPSIFFHTRHIQGGSDQGISDTVKKGVNETLKVGDNIKNKAVETADDVFNMTKESSSGVGERAKKVAQNAWESAKEGMPSKESLASVEVDGPNLHSKDAIEIAKRSINTKKQDNS